MKLSKIINAGALLLAGVLAGCTLTAPSTTAGSFVNARPEQGVSRLVPDRLSAGGERITGSGRVITEQFNIRGFDRVDISHAFQVRIVQSDSYRVEVRVDDNLREHLRVEKRGDTLLIGLEPFRNSNLRDAIMEADVHMPELRGLEVSGASDVRLSGFTAGRDFELDVSGASSVEGEITVRDVSMEVSGASRIRLRGEAGELELDVSGASDLDLSDFPVSDARIKLSGASEAEVVLRGTLDIEASGASRLYFGGSPVMGRVELSGASSIKRR